MQETLRLWLIMREMAHWQGNFRKELLWVEIVCKDFSFPMWKEKNYGFGWWQQNQSYRGGQHGTQYRTLVRVRKPKPLIRLSLPPATYNVKWLTSRLWSRLLMVRSWIKSSFTPFISPIMALAFWLSPSNKQTPCHFLRLHWNFATPIFKVSAQAGSPGCLVSMGLLQGSSRWQLRSWLEVEFYSG